MSWVVHEDMKIEMTKGDTPSFAFQAFLPDGSEYEFEEGESVVFAAKRNKADLETAVRNEADGIGDQIFRGRYKASGSGKVFLGTVFE